MISDVGLVTDSVRNKIYCRQKLIHIRKLSIDDLKFDAYKYDVLSSSVDGEKGVVLNKKCFKALKVSYCDHLIFSVSI